MDRDLAPARPGVRVELVELFRTFGKVNALDGLSLDLAPGEFVAMLGPSGCGKTTALRALAGLERVDYGSILLDGEDITRLPANKRDMGMVFQAYSLFPHMTARDNVAFGLRLRGRSMAERNKAADRMLELVHLDEQGGRYPHELSGGQQQRVALARALAIEPQMLLLDEPLSALDAKVRAQLRDEIRRIQTDTGITTLFVTHDQEEALAIADRVAVVFAGRIEQVASPFDLYERPRTAKVAEFVGLSNRLAATVADNRARALDTVLPLLPGSVAAGKASILVRPEAVTLEAGAGGSARVVTVSYLGAIGRVQARLADGALILAQMPSAELAKFNPGDAVAVTLKPVPVLAIGA